MWKDDERWRGVVGLNRTETELDWYACRIEVDVNRDEKSCSWLHNDAKVRPGQDGEEGAAVVQYLVGRTDETSGCLLRERRRGWHTCVDYGSRKVARRIKMGAVIKRRELKGKEQSCTRSQSRVLRFGSLFELGAALPPLAACSATVYCVEERGSVQFSISMSSGDVNREQ